MLIEREEEYIKRRMKMHPSAPKKLAKYVIHCELGWRKYVEHFTEARAARAFIDLILMRSREKVWKWKSETTVAAKDGVLVVRCEELEELMDAKKSTVVLPTPIPETVERFLYGKWGEAKSLARRDVPEKLAARR